MQRDALLPLLKQLRFNGMLSHFEEIVDVAALKQWNGFEFMQRFLETEVAYRQTRSLQYRLELARLPQVKTLDQFDCSQMSFQPEQLDLLAEGEFIKNKHNLLLIGGSGSGKTHLALAIAYAALQKHFRVKFYVLSDLARQLLQAKEQRYESNLMARLQRFDALVIDEMGYFPIDPQASCLLFELFSKLYEKTSLIITTHLTFDEWAPLFGSAKASKAILTELLIIA